MQKGLPQSEKSSAEFSSVPATGASLISHFQLLEAILEGAPDPIFAKDAEGRFILLNSACARLFGRARSEVYGRRMSELMDAASAQQIEQADSQIMATGEPVVTENALTQNGRMRIYLTTQSALRNAGGRVIGIVGIARDITERKKMEEALGESEARYRILTEGMPQLVWMADAEGTLQFCNRYFRDVTGLSLQEAVERGHELIHPDDRANARRKWEDAARDGKAYEIEYRLRNAVAGSYTWFSARLQPIKDKKGEILRWIGTAVDITERKKATLELQKREEQLRLAQEAGQVGSWTMDVDSGEVSFSAGFHQLLGVDPSIPITRDLVDQLVLPEDQSRLAEAFRDAASGSVRVEFRIRKENEIRWLLSLGRRVEREAKPSALFAGVTMDITAQKQAEEDLARQAAELARSNSDLQQFSSIASHDLQEPLRNMAVCSELLSRGYRDLLDQNGKQLIDLILSGARAGQALTRALLTYARTVGTSTLPKLPVPLGEVLDQALAGIKSSVQETGASITRDELPVVTGDRILLAQLLQNLLENAVKYRREVAPVIHVGCQRRGAEWILSVKDNGLGVPHAQYQRIFEPFQRLRSAKILGSGLGLATCKRIVERHGGSIWVESEPGQGSTFYFTIPAM